LRAAKTSKLVSFIAIFGLIALSILIVLILDSSSLASPTLPFNGNTPNKNPGPTGILVVQLASNQNQSNSFPNPLNMALPVEHKEMTVSEVTNSSSQYSVVLRTDYRGYASQQLSPGPYVVNLQDESLNVNIPVKISVGNETDLVIKISGSAYPLVYSEESGVSPTAKGPQSNMYVELLAGTPVASVNERVILKVQGENSGTTYPVNATVLSSQPPIQGTQWLELGTATAVDPVNATSIVLTTWTYSSFIMVGPIVSFGFPDS
jgi:hypothetical protein